MFDALPRLIARADWQKPEAYPDPDMDNSDLWAWEFLRRNQSYAEDIERLTHLNPHDREALRLRWEVSRLVSPEVAWHQLPGNFRFLANIVEVIEPSMPLGSRNIGDAPTARVATNQSVLATSRQILVRLTLDGNVDNQLHDLREKFRKQNHHPETGETTNKAITQVIFEDIKLARTETDTLPDGSQITRRVYEDNWEDSSGEQLVVFYTDEQKRVSVKHLLFALRAVDAMAIFCTAFPEDSEVALQDAMRHVARKLQPVFHKEWALEGRYAESLAAGDLARIRIDQVVHWITHGLRYTQEERYREIASSDLKKQFETIRRNQ